MTLWIAGFLLLPNSAQASSVDQVLARYNQWAKAHPLKKVAFEVSSPKSPKVTGMLLVDGDKRLLIRSKGGQTDYALSALPEGVVDIDYTAKTYDEQSYPSSIFPVQSRISSLYGYAMPGFLLRSSLKQVLGDKAEITSQSVSKGDQITSHLKTEMGTVDFTILFDRQGRIIRLHRMMQSIKGSSDTTWDLSYPPVSTKVPDSTFRLTIPLGSSPYSIEGMEYPVQREEAFPLKGWLTTSASKPYDLKGPVLVAVLDQADFSSNKSLSGLKALASSIKVVSVGNPPKGAPTPLKDKSGKNLKKINAPATPFFALVNASGKVVRTWMGYDSNHQAEFVRQVTAALKD